MPLKPETPVKFHVLLREFSYPRKSIHSGFCKSHGQQRKGKFRPFHVFVLRASRPNEQLIKIWSSQQAMAVGFYLHNSGLWCIHQFWMSYFSLANLKKFSGYQRYKQTSLTHAKFLIDCFKTVENMSDSKSISNSGVWCNER